MCGTNQQIRIQLFFRGQDSLLESEYSSGIFETNENILKYYHCQVDRIHPPPSN